MRQEMVSFLKKIPFLKDMNDWKLQLLGNIFSYVAVDTGHVIFKEGELGQEFYIVAHGKVRIYANDTEGKEREFGIHEVGGYFGEIALMINMPRTASVQAMDKSLLLCLRKADFMNFLLVAPDLKKTFSAVAKERTTQILKKFNVPFFTCIPDAKFHELAVISEVEEYPEKKIIFNQGDVGKAFYLICYGNVDVIIENQETKMLTKVKQLNPGQYFGEIALVTDSPRSATIVTATRCILLSITKDHFATFFEDNPEAYADFAIKLSRFSVPMVSILDHPVGLKLFSKFVESEYVSENIHFFEACKRYAKIKDKNTLVAEAKTMIQKFIEINAAEQVNIPSTMREELVATVRSGNVTASTFVSPMNEIIKLMSSNSLNRFKNSELFTQLLTEVGSYEGIDESVAKRKPADHKAAELHDVSIHF